MSEDKKADRCAGPDDELAITLLYAWNNADPATGALKGYEWPDGFPEGSREGWRRVMRAARYAAANSGRSLTELPSLHQPDLSKGEDASQDKREPRNSPAAPDFTINLTPADFVAFEVIVADPLQQENPLLEIMRGYTIITQGWREDGSAPEEISDANFQKIKEAVADLNAPEYKRIIIAGTSEPRVADFPTTKQIGE